MESMLRDHLERPRGLGVLARAPHTGAAGGAPCGDLLRISVHVAGDHVAEAGFEASGCASARAAGSAAVELAAGAPLLEAARITPASIAAELGGLSSAAAHAAELAADALHRALGLAAREGAATLPAAPGRTLVAMSGGVDSAAAAQLALDAGEEVLAVTLELWSDPGTDGERSCCSPQAVRGARALAHGMGLPHLTLDLRERFRDHVVEDFLDGYAGGTTPNPCVRCNGGVRFDAMLALADRLGAARLVTGHYARIADDGEGPLVRTGVDPRKDQSYVLARLTGEQLQRLRLPLGGLEKPRVRALAAAAGLPVADKPESQDLCFLAGTGGASAFMRRHGRRARGSERHGSGDSVGDIVDRAGTVLGRHDGQHAFTVGQRRGLGIASAQPLYVLAKEARRERVVVGPREALATDRVALAPVGLHRPAADADGVRLRYHAPVVPCAVEADAAEGAQLTLDRSLARPAPGQLACLMRGELVVGWGTIAA
jgi:tRNA-specific 2-thiouridylase